MATNREITHGELLRAVARSVRGTQMACLLHLPTHSIESGDISRGEGNTVTSGRVCQL